MPDEHPRGPDPIEPGPRRPFGLRIQRERLAEVLAELREMILEAMRTDKWDGDFVPRLLFQTSREFFDDHKRFIRTLREAEDDDSRRNAYRSHSIEIEAELARLDKKIEDELK